MPQAEALIEVLDRDQAPLLARRFYGDGAVSPITRSLAQVPELLEVALPFIGLALGPVSLDARAKEPRCGRSKSMTDHPRRFCRLQGLGCRADRAASHSTGGQGFSRQPRATSATAVTKTVTAMTAPTARASAGELSSTPVYPWRVASTR